MKKLFTIALMLLAQTVLFATATVSVEHKTNAVPGAMNVPVNASFSTVTQGVGAFTLYITFNNNVLDSPQLFNPAFSGIFSSTSTSGTTTTLTLLWEDLNAPTTLTGTLFEIGFNYKGGNTDLIILPSSTIGDAAANLLSPVFVNGSVTQIAITPGISVNNGVVYNSFPYKTVDIPVFGHQLYNIGGFDLKLALSTAILNGNVTIVNRRADLNSKGSWTTNYNNGNIFVVWTKNPAMDNLSIPDSEKLFDIRFNYTYGISGISFVGTTNQIAQNVPPFYPEFGNAIFTSGSINTTKDNPTVTFPTATSITYGQTLADASLNNNGSASYTGDPNPVAGTFAYQNSSFMPNAGIYQATVVFTPTNSVAYNSVTGTVNVEVNKANQTITWSNPAAITYGTTLSATQFNATVAGVSGGSVPGVLTYYPTAGTLLNTGTHTLTVTAAATGNYNEATAQASIVVNKANQTITWSNPSAITYGTALSATQLNAAVAGVSGGSAPGALSYNPVSGTLLNAGAHTLTVTAAATDNYNGANAQVDIIVNKAPSTIFVSGNTSYTYNGLAQGPDAAIVNGSSGAVSYQYSGIGNTVYPTSVNKPIDEGTYIVVATVEGDANYLGATSPSFQFMIGVLISTIEVVGNTSYSYNGIAQGPANAIVTGSAGALSFVYSGIGNTVYGPSSLLPVNAGSYEVVATVAPDLNYSGASSAPFFFTINKVNQTINWIIPADIAYGTLLSNVQLNATVDGIPNGTAPGALHYSPAAGTLLPVGTHVLNVIAASTVNYNEVTAAVHINVIKGNQTITWNNPAAITYGTPLSATQLNATVAGVIGGAAPGALTYNPVIGTMLGAGTHTLNVSAASTVNYLEATAQVSIVVNKAPSTIFVSGSTSYTFNGLPQGPAAAVVNGSTGAVSYLYSGTGSTVYPLSANKPVNEGTYSVIATVAEDANYLSAVSEPFMFMIGNFISFIEVTGATESTYNGNHQGPTAAVVIGSGGIISFEYSGVGNTSYAPTSVLPINSGTYKAVASVEPDINFTGATSAPFFFTILKAEQFITWTNPANITYGELLSPIQLNAFVVGVSGGSAPGALTYNPIVGTMLGAGTHTLNVMAAATDNYNEAIANVSIVVNKANQTITWSNPEAILFGTALSSAQLNATVVGVTGGSSPGNLTYSPTAGTVLPSGTHTLTVTASSTSNYNEAVYSVQIIVNEGNAASLTGQLKIFGDPINIDPFNYPSNFYLQMFDGDLPVGTPQLLETGSNVQLKGLFQYHGLDVTKNYTLRLWETSPNNLISGTWTWNSWSGITALDAFIMQSMIVEGECVVNFPWIGPPPFTDYSKALADVNNSGTLTGVDPLIILFRIVGFPGTSPFPGGRHNFVFAGKMLGALNDCVFPNAPDVIFNSFGDYIANSPANTVYHEALIGDLQPGQNVFNIYMNVAGDMNSSFTPCDLKSAPRIQHQQQINTSVGSVIDIPVMVDKDVNLNAVTLGLRYDKNLIRINSISGFDLYNLNPDDGTVKIAWSEIQSKKLSAGDVLFYINATVLSDMQGNESYLELLPMTELVESGGLINIKTGLTTRSLSTHQIVPPTNTHSMIVHHFYPNPFSETGSLNISLPAKGKLNISVFNQFGQTVQVLTEEVAEAGLFNLQLSRTQLNGSGIYTYRVMLQTDEKQFVAHGNVILLK